MCRSCQSRAAAHTESWRSGDHPAVVLPPCCSVPVLSYGSLLNERSRRCRGRSCSSACGMCAATCGSSLHTRPTAGRAPAELFFICLFAHYRHLKTAAHGTHVDYRETVLGSLPLSAPTRTITNKRNTVSSIRARHDGLFASSPPNESRGFPSCPSAPVPLPCPTLSIRQLTPASGERPRHRPPPPG